MSNNDEVVPPLPPSAEEEAAVNNFDSEDMVANEEVINRIMKLKEQSEKLDELELEYRKERIALEASYSAKRAPYFKKRMQIVTGATDLEGEPIPEPKEGEEVMDHSIPMFWLKAMINHESLHDALQESDFEALSSLKDITVEYNEDMTELKLSFFFGENNYFTNTILTKTYKGIDYILNSDDEGSQEIIGSKIEWKAGKSLTSEEVRQKQKIKSGKRKGEVRYIQREVHKKSFFWYFSDPIEPVDEEEDDDERAPFDYEEDFEIGEIFRSQIVPNAVNWFTGEAVDDVDSDDDDYGNDLGDSDSDEDDDDEVEEGADSGTGATSWWGGTAT